MLALNLSFFVVVVVVENAVGIRFLVFKLYTIDENYRLRPRNVLKVIRGNKLINNYRQVNNRHKYDCVHKKNIFLSATSVLKTIGVIFKKINKLSVKLDKISLS